jgi:hypothetical protein
MVRHLAGREPFSRSIKTPRVPSDASRMRIVLEWLGIVEPQRGRREPVALPAWAPLVVAAAATTLIYLASVVLRALLI